MSTKVVVSVSMDGDLAAGLRVESQECGESFSGLVCKYVVAGRYHERTSLLTVLDDQDLEQGDDAADFVPRQSQANGARGTAPVTGAGRSGSSDASRSPGVAIEPAEEDLADSRRPAQDPPVVVVAHETTSLKILDGPESVVYRRLSDEPRSADEIAAALEWPVGAVRETLESFRAAGVCEFSEVGGFYWVQRRGEDDE